MSKFRIRAWYVEDVSRNREFTELQFRAEFESPAHYGISASIGLYDADGIEEFGRRYWLRVVQGEQGWIETDVADSFEQCRLDVDRIVLEMRDELRDLAKSEE